MHPIFARITKIDELTRTVCGRAAQEVIDRDNELFDYASSKPEFMKWSAEVSADTGGKSLGNVRSMHGNCAAGKITEINFDDVEKAIDISAKIVDDNEWEKCLEGVHTGFSIGGRYIKRWAEPINGKMVQRYTAAPSEISIVDRPCIPTAKFFSIHKRDGSIVEKAFVDHTPSVEIVEGKIVLKTFSTPTDATSGVNDYDEEGAKKPPKSKKKPKQDPAQEDELSAKRAKKMSPKMTARTQNPNADDAFDEDANDATSYGKRDFSDDERSSMADSGEAMPDGSFPIKTAKDVKNAVLAHGRAKDPVKAKAHIKSRAKAIGATKHLPDDWKKSDEGDMQKVDVTTLDQKQLEKFWKAHGGKFFGDDALAKGVYDVASLASLITQLTYLCNSATTERRIEGDESTVPEQLRSAAAELLSVLSDMASEESGEIKEGTTAEDVLRDIATGQVSGVPSLMGPGLYCADVGELAKSLRTALFGADVLEKRGARNSKKDMDLLQKAHDALCELGASCGSAHDKNGAAVDPTEALKADGSNSEDNDMSSKVNKADAISAEGNKRGASVTDPKLPAESSNNTDSEVGGGAAAGAVKGKSRKDMDADEARKKKARADDDEDGDDDEDDMDDDSDDDSEEDDDEDDAPMPPPKAKGKKSKKAKKAAGFTADDLAKAVAVGIKAYADGQASVGAVAVAKGDGAVTIPRLGGSPNLMQVGKDGTVQKLGNVDDLKKSVTAVVAGKIDAGDNDTATLIKAIHANPAFRIDPMQIPSR